MNLFDPIDRVDVDEFRKKSWNVFRFASLGKLLPGWLESDEDVERETQTRRDYFEEGLKTENASKHKPLFQNNRLGVDVDLSEHLAKINKGSRERLLAIIVNDYNRNPTTCSRILDEGDAVSVSCPNFSMKLGKFVDECVESGNSSAILILAHNHPTSIIAKPSEGDLITLYKMMFTATQAGISLADYVVTTRYDMWSAKQNDETENTDYLRYCENWTESNEMLEEFARKYGKGSRYWALKALENYRGLY